ncbi:dipeptidase PepV [Iocasia frigidifontis]|uniref:Dipeptidase PepV n=1 Tax=Iocasia fonsfrigidae TaxID=2682810 RepID=A0A8A7K9A0_9FIRM|nr:dipeptidase PepV [Iocasia fonsfrigidae]QTL98383.1 dipeptidase PepV [Iocasia fonsfrigidae]
MNKKINQRVDELRGDIVKALQGLLQIRSVKSSPEEGKPFGKGIDECLNEFLSLADKMGLVNKNIAGHAGYIEIGQGEKMLGILCHLDVVPEGKDWTYPPYGGEIHHEKIYGRGTIDDKGPAVASLYALKAVKDSGITLNKRVRLIVGTDEENSWEGLNYYLKNEEIPDLAFTPDADFPVIFAEKGILNITMQYEIKTETTEKTKIRSITGGNAVNMVPDYCQAVLESNCQAMIQKRINDFNLKDGFSLKLEVADDLLIIKSYGVSAHGSLPEEGINAVANLLVFLGELESINGCLDRFINLYKQKIGLETNGKSIGCLMEDAVSGKLTFNVGMIDVDENSCKLGIDLRYPVTKTKEEVIDCLKSNLKGTGIELLEGKNHKPLFVSQNSRLVSTLTEVYNKFSGEKREPLAIGGGTYARALENAVAFGPLFPGQKELAHQKDEYISIKDLVKITKIYATAVEKLAQ